MNILSEAISEVLDNGTALFKALLLPFLFIAVATIIGSLIPHVIAYIVVMIFIFMQVVIIAVTTHRIILLGAESVPTWGMYKFTFREYYFAAHAVGIFLMFFALMQLIPSIIANYQLASIAGWMMGLCVSILALALILWFIGRLALVFPGIAINQGISFRMSWELTEKHQQRMFMTIAVLPFVLAITIGLLNAILSFIPVLNILTIFLPFLEVVIVIAMLSVSYRYIFQNHYNRSLAV